MPLTPLAPGRGARAASGSVSAGCPTRTTEVAATAAQRTRAALHLSRPRRPGSLSDLRAQHWCLKLRCKPYAWLPPSCPQGGGRRCGALGTDAWQQRAVRGQGFLPSKNFFRSVEWGRELPSEGRCASNVTPVTGEFHGRPDVF